MESLKRSRVTSEINHLSPNKVNQLGISVSPSKKLKKSFSLSPQKGTINQSEIENDLQNWFDDDGSFAFFEEKMNNENIPSNHQDPLDLTRWSRCFIREITRDPKNFDAILKLQEESSLKYGFCRLQGPWCYTKIEENDLVYLKGVWNSILNCYVVNALDGIIITNPDCLISGTSVVGSLFCARRGILQDKFRGLDAGNKVMVIGSIIHELFQTVLAKKLKTVQEIENLVEDLLKSEEMIFTLYSSKMSLNEARCEVEKFLPNIINFVDRYIEQKGSANFTNDGMFQGSIDKIQDIEENLWVPQLGMKGKIDISVMVSRKRRNTVMIKSKEQRQQQQQYMPLELKTGRASFSNEHKGQLILYQMMLREIGKEVNSGLLLYLRDGIMKEIRSTRNEERDLIMLRNELAYYLTRNMKLRNQEIQSNDDDYGRMMNSLLNQFESLELPEPINHHSACSKCPYQTICSTFLKTDEKFQFTDKNPLEMISKECTSHLTDIDYQYFTHWCGILSLEDQEIKNSSYNIRNLWKETPEERYKQGRAITNLKIHGNVEFNEQKHLHTFKMDKNGDDDFTLFEINIGDYVIVSSKERIAIASGHVCDLNKHSIALSLERNLLQNYANKEFIIDKLESQSMNIFNYTNLGILLDNSDDMNRLREIVIGKCKTSFSNTLPKLFIIKQASGIFNELNPEQRDAALKALTMDNYLLIKGFPGTGKTQTIVAIVRLLRLLNKSVLITSHTHSAVDNILIRLKRYNLPFLRLGSIARVSSHISDNSEYNLIKNYKTPEDLKNFYNSYSITGVTCLGCNHSIFQYRKFDVCIIDEATQLFQPTSLRPLFYSDKFILVGDPNQLPPIIRSKDAKLLEAEETLFDRLDSTDAVITLSHQFRMNRIITKLANDLTYQGYLFCANSNVMQSHIILPNHEFFSKNYTKEKWILYTLEPHIDQSVILLNTQHCLDRHCEFQNSVKKNDHDLKLIEQRFQEQTTKNKKEENKKSLPLKKLNYTNYCEAAIIFYLIEALLKCGFKAENIGVIASYRAQVELMRKLLENFQNYHSSEEAIDFSGLEVNTVDQYQGCDKEIIFYSCTRTIPNDISSSSTSTTTSLDKERKKETEILEDHRRLTVAITRSKYKLIIVGDEMCLQRYTPFMQLFSRIPKRCKLILEHLKFGFSWDVVFEKLKTVMTMKVENATDK